MENIGGIFILLCGGILLAFITLFIEMIFIKKMNK